jgi:hypothetical protein
MESQFTIRDYTPEDFERVRSLHEASGIDYRLPNLASPLFLVTKVVEYRGIIRQCGGLYLQVECYLFADHTDWAGPEIKLAAIQALDRSTMKEAWLKGIDCACLWLPPGMDRFGERLVEDLGFTRDRADWVSYSKRLNENNN